MSKSNLQSMKKSRLFFPALIIAVVMVFALIFGFHLGEVHDEQLAEQAAEAYVTLDGDTIPFRADISSQAAFTIRTNDSTTYFCDIIYPSTSAHLYCTFRWTDTCHIGQLHHEARRMVSFHSKVALAIEEVPLRNQQGASGSLFVLKGDVATPYQLALTDGNTYFFNASLYFDSGAHAGDVPDLVAAMRRDIDRLVYSFSAIR